MVYCNLSNANINDDYFWLQLINNIKHSLHHLPNTHNKILVVKIQEIVCDDDTMIPKLEFKNS